MKKLLVIDDMPRIHESYQMILEGKYTIVSAFDAGSALEVLSKQSVDLVLLDYGLEKTNGIEVAKQIKAKYPILGIIMVTAHKDPLIRADADSVGISLVLEKPFKLSEFIGAIDKHVGGNPKINS